MMMRNKCILWEEMEVSYGVLSRLATSTSCIGCKNQFEELTEGISNKNTQMLWNLMPGHFDC
jgi:hypothetical protein